MVFGRRVGIKILYYRDKFNCIRVLSRIKTNTSLFRRSGEGKTTEGGKELVEVLTCLLDLIRFEALSFC